MGLSSLILADFSRNGNTVTDSSTGLMWQDDAIGSSTGWLNAINRCEALSLDGYNDWRLPNIIELKSIADKSRANPALNSIFVNTASYYYWSATTASYNGELAWIVDFKNGRDDVNDKDNTDDVRCVRSF